MSDLSAKFAALEAQVATEHTETLASIADINTALSFLGTSLDLIIANNATNTRLLLAAIGQNSPCMPCPTPPIVIPPLGETTIPVNTEACQRAQAFIAFMMGAFTVLDVASAVGIGFNPSLITDAYNQVIAGLSGGDSPNPPSFPEAVQIVGDLVNYVFSNVTRGATLVDSFAPLVLSIRDGLYVAGSPGDAQAAYRASINSSALDSDIKEVLKDAAYNDIFSYFFDPASTPDLTGFDGGVCSLPAGTCFEVDFTEQHFDNGTTSIGVAVPIGPFTPVTTINTTSGLVTSDLPAFFAGDLTGWTLEMLSGDTLVNYRAGDLSSSGFINTSALYGTGGGPVALPSGTGSFFFHGSTGARGRFCSPE